jgi:mannose/cellobiose epimerase-like protein (N-acyl-D-glucosamine 2-epimerase family)
MIVHGLRHVAQLGGAQLDRLHPKGYDRWRSAEGFHIRAEHKEAPLLLLTPTAARYRALILPDHPTGNDLHNLVEPYRAIIMAQFHAVLDRTERSEYYPWIDTKINLITGEEMPFTHPLLGRDLVSGWVQGRGLEAVIKFAAWLAHFAGDAEVDRLITRGRRLAADLLALLQKARAHNGGHLHFFMTPAGRAFDIGADAVRIPLALDAASPHGYSDLFAAKGMYAAAYMLGDPAAMSAARAFCLAVYRDILARRFRSDQPQPASGARAWVGDAFSHGPYMISLGMAALFAEFEPGPQAVDLGLTLARHVLAEHVNLDGKWPQFQEYDLVEFVDAAGQPYVDEAGRIISDPGHSLEFVGLFLKFSRAVRRYGGATPAQQAALTAIERTMPALLARSFANGWRPAVGGICKTMDLLTRAPVDDTMPWWSLPETMRAALAAWRVAEGDETRRDCLAILAQAHNAFVAYYVRPQIHLMAVKVRDARGQVVDVMPAYPDADPGYHTALSLMDALDLIQGA